MSSMSTNDKLPVDMQFGDALAIYTAGFAPIAWMIRRRTRGPWNHIAFATDKDELCEATMRGVVFSSVSRYANDWWVHLRPTKPWTGVHRSRAMRFICHHVGDGYDWLGVLGFTFLSPSFNEGTRSRWFCSEWFAAIYESAGIKLLERTRPSLLSPVDIVRSPYLEVVSCKWPERLQHWLEC